MIEALVLLTLVIAALQGYLWGYRHAQQDSEQARIEAFKRDIRRKLAARR